MYKYMDKSEYCMNEYPRCVPYVWGKNIEIGEKVKSTKMSRVELSLYFSATSIACARKF